MKSNLCKTVCSMVVLCLALNLTPVMAMGPSQAIPDPTKMAAAVDLPPEFSGNGLDELREGAVEWEYVPPKPEDLARTAEQVRTFSCSAVTDVPEYECVPLVALYGSTNGAGWYNKSGWLSSTTVANWYGIAVTAGRVTSIGLATNGLTGSIPTGLGVLTNLKYLDMHRNQLSGSIPTDLGSLINLEYLELYYNNLSGSVPTQLGNLSSLKWFDLDNNQLTGEIPPQLSLLSNLKWLRLNENQLSGIIPPALGDLGNLEALMLNNNQLSGIIPPALGGLTKLIYLNLEYNQLSGNIPAGLGNLLFFNCLYLHHNQLTGSIPPELGNLTQLRQLYLNDNQLSGNIPAQLGNLTKLERLYLNNNQLSGSIPAQLGNLHGDFYNLYYLYLNNNLLSGSIPASFGNLTKLSYLDLSQNKLSGDVPAELTGMVNLCTIAESWLPNCRVEYGDGLNLGYNHLNVPALEPPASFLANKDPDWTMTQAVEQVIDGESGGSLLSNDGSTQVDVPADAVSGDVTFLFEPQPAPSQETGELNFAGNSFELTAEDSLSNPVTVFSQPLTLTIHYDDAGIGGVLEGTLRLYYWDEDASAWADVASTCSGGEYTRDLVANWLSVPLCHLSEFALLGTEPAYSTYLPLIIR